MSTIQRAADEMGPGDTCIVGGGIYRETVRPRSGGAQGQPLRFVAAAGERVVIQGTDRVEGTWSAHQGAIHKTQVDATFEQVFVDGEMMIEARWPNARFDELLERGRWAHTSTGSRYGKVVDPELAQTGIDWTGAVATLNVAHQFFTWTRPVIRHEAGSDTLEYDRDLPGITHFADKTEPWERNVYYLTGKLEALDQATEWFLDPDEAILYLWAPAGDDPSGHEVEVKVRDYGFDAEGLEYIEIEGFELFGCTFRFEGCNHCTVDGCDLRFPTFTRWLTDMEASSAALASTAMRGDHNRVVNTRLAHSSTGGIHMAGSHNTVDNCLVHDFCWNGSLRYVGISMGPHQIFEDEAAQEGGCVVRRCTVRDGGNACVLVSGMPDHVVEYCHIHDGGRACKDVSLLYTHLPVIRGTVFRYNWVHDCHAPHIALGIRGDDQTRGLTIHHNVVWNCGWEGIVAKGDDNRVHHNTCFGNGLMDIRLDVDPEPRKPWRKQWPLLERQNEHSEAYNNGAADIRGGRSREGIAPGGRTGNNLAADLVDPEGYDFRPREGSTLIDAGRPIPGINDGCVGKAPDVGAYEHGGEPWVAGCSLTAAGIPPRLPSTPGPRDRSNRTRPGS